MNGTPQALIGQGTQADSSEGKSTSPSGGGPQIGLQGAERFGAITLAAAEREQRALDNFERVLATSTDPEWRAVIQRLVRKVTETRC